MKGAEKLEDAGDNLKGEDNGGEGNGIESTVEDTLGSEVG